MTIALLAWLALGPPAPADRPNVILILADDIGISGFSCYGGAFQTPRLDELARTGARFDFCFAAPLCGPSRALLMTGRYAFRTGVVTNGTGGAASPRKEVPLARVLKEAGYATAVAGKWRQLQYLTTPEEGRAWGFDEFMVWGVGGGRGRAKGKGERYWEPAYNHNGAWREDIAERYGPDVLHEFVVDFITRHKDGPFFVYYPMPLVHSPIERTPDSTGEKGKFFADNIAYMDKLVGKLADELDRLGLRERTLILFTGDNGTVGGRTVNGKLVDGGKGTMKEGGSRVPLIANWKGTIAAGTVLPDLVDFSDFFPTIVELAGAKSPPGVPIDGRSFAPRLRGEAGRPREWVYIQLGNARYVRDARWKLTGDGTLLDMREAPFAELRVDPAAADPAAADARRRLQTALDSLK
jgi:arylsulfatase A